MPHYFSGTNCRASGSAYAEAGPPGGFPVFMTAAELKVGGQLAAAWVWNNGEPQSVATGLSAMFDSTRFAHNSDLEVRFRAWDNYGRTYEDFDTATVVNRAVLYGRYDIDIHQLSWDEGRIPPAWVYGNSTWASVGLVSQKMSAMGIHVQAQNTSMLWEATDYLLDLSGATTSYVASHGNSTPLFWSDKNDYHPQKLAWPDGPPQLTAEKIVGVPNANLANSFPILPVRQAANGTGLPPFNTGQPPVNVAFVMACSTASGDSFAEGYLYPQGNAYTGAPHPIPENQAWLGFNVNVKLNQYRRMADAFYSAMADGATVLFAREEAEDKYKSVPAPTKPFLNIRGDRAAKLHGVYDGSEAAAPSTNWVRQL